MIPGVAVACIDQDNVKFLCTGYSDLKNKFKVTKNTIFQLGSIAKPFSSLALLRVLAKHKLSLTDSIEKVISTNLEFTEQLTFERLLSHTSGLNYLISNSAKSKNDHQRKITLQKLKVYSNPKHNFLYTASGYYLVQLALEALEEGDISYLLQKNILNPLSLKNTSFNWPNKIICSKGYTYTNRPVTNFFYHEKTASAICSNLLDMSKFVTSFWNGDLRKLIDPKYLDEIFLPNRNNYHLGFSIDIHRSHLYLSHHGTNRGWNSYFGIFPDLKQGIVILTNSDWGLPFIDTIQEIWISNLLKTKSLYKVSLGKLTVNLLIAFSLILFIMIWKKCNGINKFSFRRFFYMTLFLFVWYFVFYSPFFVYQGWVISLYFPWRFHYLSSLISLMIFFLLLKPIFILKKPLSIS